MKSFKEFVQSKFLVEESGDKDWRKEYVKLEKGFIPQSNLRPIVQAFIDSGSIKLTNDTSSEVTMPKKNLYVVGGAVRDFLLGKTPSDIDLVTNATPEQIAQILHSAGFKVPGKDGEPNYDKSGKSKEMDLPFKPKIASASDKKIWYLKGRDSGKKPYVIAAKVNGDEFEISTLRKDPKSTSVKGEVDFTDNPIDDSEKRDLTINSMYIELSKADGENNKLYDPTKKGYHDAHAGNIRTVGKAEDRFDEDKIRVLRAVRFYTKYGKDKSLSEEIIKTIPKFRDLEGVELEQIKTEFIKGLDDSEIDPRKYIRLYSKFDLLSTVLPGVYLRTDVPTQLRKKKDRFLALAWILQDNPIDKVEEVLSGERYVGGKKVSTGWSSQDRGVVSFLLKIKEFDSDRLDEMLEDKKAHGVTKEQILKWVEMFDVVDGDTVRSTRPSWAKRVRSFANFAPDHSKLISWFAKDTQGSPTAEIHPEIVSRNLHDVPDDFRSSVVKDLNKNILKQMFNNLG